MSKKVPLWEYIEESIVWLEDTWLFTEFTSQHHEFICSRQYLLVESLTFKSYDFLPVICNLGHFSIPIVSSVARLREEGFRTCMEVKTNVAII